MLARDRTQGQKGIENQHFGNGGHALNKSNLAPAIWRRAGVLGAGKEGGRKGEGGRRGGDGELRGERAAERFWGERRKENVYEGVYRYVDEVV